MSSIAYVLARYLSSNGVGTYGGDTGWSVAVGREPVLPDDALTLYDTGGGEPDTDQLDIMLATTQVRTRCFDYVEGYAKQEEARDLLILPAPLITGGVHFLGVRMTSNITTLYRDDRDRNILVSNYEAQYERS